MKIAVLLKQTPDTESIIQIAPDGRSIVSEGLKWIINPYDEFAIEAALRIKEQFTGEVTVISVGSDRVIESLRTAMAMGADNALLIGDGADGTDSLSVASLLSEAVRECNAEVVFCGARAVDYDWGQRGAIVAELLDWPHVGPAVSVECDGKSVSIDRPIEGGMMRVQAELPALVTIGGSHSIWNPRYASLPGIMKAKRKPLSRKNPSEFSGSNIACGEDAARIGIVSLELPPQRNKGQIIGGDLDTEGKAIELVRVLHEEAKLI